jgi:hypothetical protein
MREVVGTMQTWSLSDLASLAVTSRMGKFVPDANTSTLYRASSQICA